MTKIRYPATTLLIAGFTGLVALFGLCTHPTTQARAAAAVAVPPRAPDIAAGLSYAKQMCATCHDVTSRVDDTFARSRPPSFYAVANARTTTAMGLQAFLVTSHAPMPNFIIDEKDRRDVIAYILSLRAEKPSQL
jgi:mono/diheme cytochrome c family protein